ncbi:hypothetical protein CTH30272_03084 [Allocatenococcus thiocycli]|nr:hypothetical protein CTH30272_03084 [Catenococcus thiocycli]
MKKEITKEMVDSEKLTKFHDELSKKVININKKHTKAELLMFLKPLLLRLRYENKMTYRQIIEFFESGAEVDGDIYTLNIQITELSRFYSAHKNNETENAV